MKLRFKRWIWILLVLFAPLACLLLYLVFPLAPTSPPSPRYVSLAFLGHTNDVTGQELYVFTISNFSRAFVACFPVGAYPCTNNAGEWSPDYGSFGRIVLEAGDTKDVVVKPPTNVAAWRFGIVAYKPSNPARDKFDMWLAELERTQRLVPERAVQLLLSEHERSHVVYCEPSRQR